MNTFQIVMLAMAGLLIASMFWGQIKNLFSQINVAPKKPDGLPKPDELVEPNLDSTPSNLVEVVAAWEHLKKGCEKHKLKKAVAALKSIFPLFVIEEGDELNV